MNEIWKPLKNWEDYYEVSNTGKIRSKERIIQDKNFSKNGNKFVRKRTFKSKELLGVEVNDKGHLSVGLYKNGRGSSQLIHRLIAEAFIPNPNNYPLVDHIDGNCKNNKLENLRWANWEHNNSNTPYVRYLQTVLEKNNIRYEGQYEYYYNRKEKD